MSYNKNQYQKGMSLTNYFVHNVIKRQFQGLVSQGCWSEGFCCKKCGYENNYCEIRSHNFFQCNRCYHQTSLSLCTIYEQTKIYLINWSLISYLLAQSRSKKGKFWEPPFGAVEDSHTDLGCVFSRAFGVVLACMLLTLGSYSMAETVAPAGCPLLHCTVEATSVMYQPIVQKVTNVTNNNTIGSTKAQGCSGNGSSLFCLFNTDNITGAGKGTLKMLDAMTLQVIWGSAAENSYDLKPMSSAGAQAPLVLSNGWVAAGDNSVHVLYDTSGAMRGKVAVGGNGYNLGLTPVSDIYGIVTQTDGVLTLVDMSTWQAIRVLTLRDPITNGRVKLTSPSSGSNNVLYAVGNNSANNHGFLFSVAVDPETRTLKLKSTSTFTGKTGATPVVVVPSMTGFENNLVLLHVPGLIKDAEPQNRLLGLLDTAFGFALQWTIPLAEVLPVAPTIDQSTQSLFFVHNNGDATVYQYSFLSGAPINTFDIRTIGGFSSTFSLNGHLNSIQAGDTFTLLISGGNWSNWAAIRGQYAIAFTPFAAPSSLLWAKKTFAVPDIYTAAWNLGISSQPDVFCPIVVGRTSGISRLCDFGM